MTQDLSDSAPERRAAVEAVAARLLQKSHIYGVFLTNLRFVSVTRGVVVSQLVLEDKHLNSKGGIHGAVSATIIDFVTGLGIASYDLREQTGVSLEMNISYLSTAKCGDTVEIESKVERIGGTVGCVTVTISKVEEDGGRTTVTIGRHTKYVKQRTAPAPAA